jgi:hypothetical protein
MEGFEYHFEPDEADDGWEPEPGQLDPAGRALSIIPGCGYPYGPRLALYQAAEAHLAKLTDCVEILTLDEYRGMEKYLLRAAVFFLWRWRLEHRLMWLARFARALVLLAALLAVQAARAIAQMIAATVPRSATALGTGDRYARILLIAPAAPPRSRTTPVHAGAAT